MFRTGIDSFPVEIVRENCETRYTRNDNLIEKKNIQLSMLIRISRIIKIFPKGRFSYFVTLVFHFVLFEEKQMKKNNPYFE